MKFILTFITAMCISFSALASYNLTSLGVDDNGKAVFRITNSGDSDSVFTLSKYGSGSSETFGVRAGEKRVVTMDGSGTYILKDVVNGGQKTKASGPHAYTPPESPYAEKEVVNQDNVVQDTAINENRSSITNNKTNITNNRSSITDNRTEINNNKANIANNTSAIEVLNDAVKDIRENIDDLNAGVAGAFAAASHQFNTQGNLQVSIAAGSYRSEGAGSVALGGALNEKVFINANATFDSRGNEGYGAGMTYSF